MDEAGFARRGVVTCQPCVTGQGKGLAGTEARCVPGISFPLLEVGMQRWWRDASIAYWQSVNGLPLPQGSSAPAHSLDHYQSLAFPEAPGDT